MSSNKPFQAYQNNAVNTASGGELTLMLYNGCIKFIKQAMRDMNDQNYEAKNSNIQKALNIIQELMLTLDQEVEISQQMLPLYEYMQHLLKTANINNDLKKLEEVLQFAVEFRDTWKQVVKTSRQKQFVQGAHI
ncbi:flagellar export chaperone FliS [Virgibacillus halotolerans]|uniref:flagellar export chaperone FliS n=1 Tax=Virgibacillus halotolerans TaxID=1071053 RepID=UPI00195F747B|nr:flagellar export chaperone FliS [Virgibacillus halotolerans]